MKPFQTAGVSPSSSPRKRHNGCLSWTVFLLVISIITVVCLQYFTITKIQQSKNNLPLPTVAHNITTTKQQKLLVTFVVPSTLRRSTLNRTIQSLQHQTTAPNNWEAVVGVDLVRSWLKETDIPNKSAAFVQDPRVHYAPIHVQSANRGIYGNAAGQIRNEIVKQFVKSDWVAFVDDDDTVLPQYVEYLLQAIRQQPLADVVVFRMRDRVGNILPPVQHQEQLAACNVGISFAVRKELFLRNDDPVVFVPGETEDFVFLKTAFQKGSMILLSSCVSYFVRQSADESVLTDSTGKGPCNFSIVKAVTE